MHRKKPIAQALYDNIYPRPTMTDPQTFSAHLGRNLVPEVRIEVATFYGNLNSTEARYPGLNYCYKPHRMRLGRFKHHRRLFQAFEELGLTDHEIQEFCCWEGTKWARERFEKDEGIKVHDTTGDEIGPWIDPRLTPSQPTSASDAPFRGNSMKRSSVLMGDCPTPPAEEEDRVLVDTHMRDSSDACPVDEPIIPTSTAYDDDAEDCDHSPPAILAPPSFPTPTSFTTSPRSPSPSQHAAVDEADDDVDSSSEENSSQAPSITDVAPQSYRHHHRAASATSNPDRFLNEAEARDKELQEQRHHRQMARALAAARSGGAGATAPVRRR